MAYKKIIKNLIGALGIISLASCGELLQDAVQSIEEALSIDQLSAAEIASLKSSAGWDDTKLANFVIHGGIDLPDSISIDLSKEVDLPLPFKFNAPSGNSDTSKRSLALLKAINFKIGEQSFTRFRIITIARLNTDGDFPVLKVDGTKFNQYLDDEQIISKANNNQAGKYLLVEGQGDGGFVYISGSVKLKKNDETESNVKDAMVFSDKSPFVTQSGSSGKFFLAALPGDQIQIEAYKKDMHTEAAGTGETASMDIWTSASTSDITSNITAKAGTAAVSTFNSENKAATPTFSDSTMISATIYFYQPPTITAPPTLTAIAGTGNIDAPSTDYPAAPTPPSGSVTMYVDPAADKKSEYQVDMGCVGKDDSGNFTAVFDPSKYHDYTNGTGLKGWRIRGDGRITNEAHNSIFGAPSSVGNSYLDKLKGYCVITTGNAIYKQGGDSTNLSHLKPIQGKRSKIKQRLYVPDNAKSIQLRVAFFSQEFPAYVNSSFNDSFKIKFKESTGAIASGNVNDLAGDDLTTCSKSGWTSGTKVTCGEWESINGSEIGNNFADKGKLWDIDSSTDATSQGSKYHCGSGKCYHGWVPPRVICKDLKTEDIGKIRTLIMKVADAGDSVYDSALAVDSVVFSTQGCTSLFTGEARSKLQ